MLYCIISFIMFICSQMVVIAQNVIGPCERGSPPKNFDYLDNCSLVCSTLFQHNIDTKNNEVILCSGNMTVVTCSRDSDCRQYSMGSLCKKIPCFCSDRPGVQLIYVLDPSSKVRIPSIDVCVVSAKFVSPDAPIVPFPWGTLLVVFAIVASFVVCLLAVRWISPVIRRMQAKAIARNRRISSDEDDGTLFSPIALQESTRPTFLPRRTQRAALHDPQAYRLRIAQRRAMNQRSISTDASSALSPEKPPPYELAIQEDPPSYNELEEEPLNPSGRVNCDNTNTRQTINESLLRPAPSLVSITTI